MNRAEIVALIRAAQFENIDSAYLETLLKPCITIKTMPTRETDLVIGASKMGGPPDLPVGIGWPRVSGQPLAFIAQFRLSDVSPFDESGLLPPAGMIYFFAPTEWNFRTDPHKVTFHPSEITQLIRCPVPTDLAQSSGFRACSLTFGKDYTLPTYESIFFKFNRGKVNDSVLTEWGEYNELQKRVSPGLGHQLLGHAWPMQMGMERDNTEALLFQVNEDFGMNLQWPGSGTFYYWIKENELRERRFDDVRTILQTT